MTIDLYKTFGVSSSATTQEIRSAYKKLALQYHPDKNAGSTEKFQELSKYYQILIDPSKRQVYDKTGSIEDTIDVCDMSWKEYFDHIERVTEDKIKEYEKQYRYSDTERQDVLQAYTKTKGSLLDIIDHVPLCTLDDIDRFKNLIQEAIDQGEVEQYKQFPKVSKRALANRKKKAEQEANQVKELEKEKVEQEQEKCREDQLRVELKRKNEQRLESLIAKLESKTKKTKKSKKETGEPSEEEFLKWQEKMFGKK